MVKTNEKFSVRQWMGGEHTDTGEDSEYWNYREDDVYRRNCGYARKLVREHLKVLDREPM